MHDPKIVVPTPDMFYNTATFKVDSDAAAPDDTKCHLEVVAANGNPTDDYRRLVSGFKNIATSYQVGCPLMVNHDTYSKDSLPRGRTYEGKFDEDAKEVYVKAYIDRIPFNETLLSLIEAGTLTDVSMSSRGKFTCSIDDSPMSYWFGCRAYGHYPGDSVLLDKQGNPTEDVEAAVQTVPVYADFHAESASELSLVWKGAMDGAKIIKKFSYDPQDHARILAGIQQMYADGHFKNRDGYLDRMCASYGDLTSILAAVPPTHSETSKQFHIETNPLHTQKETKNMNDKMNTADFPVEAQAMITELQEAKSASDAQLQALQPQVNEMHTLQAKATSLETQVKTLEARVSELTEFEAENKTLRVYKQRYDTYLAKLRDELNTAKRRTNASNTEKVEFEQRVAQMTDAANMIVLLDEVKANSVGVNSYRILDASDSEDESINHEHFDQREFNKKLAAI